jgi:hypothetical protein
MPDIDNSPDILDKTPRVIPQMPFPVPDLTVDKQTASSDMYFYNHIEFLSVQSMYFFSDSSNPIGGCQPSDLSFSPSSA